MPLQITSAEALWFLPFVLPICLWVAYSDLSAMRIRNQAVMALAVVFLVIGLFALPLPEVHRQLGPMSLQQALETLAGPAFQLVEDPVHRLVAFERCAPALR